MGPAKSDNNKQPTTETVITFSDYLFLITSQTKRYP